MSIQINRAFMSDVQGSRRMLEAAVHYEVVYYSNITS